MRGFKFFHLKFFAILLLLFIVHPSFSVENVDYRQEMRNFVISISNYAKSYNPNFSIITQNGVEIISLNGEPDGELAYDYLMAIDGQGQEDLFYGYVNDNEPTPQNESEWLTSFLDILKGYNKSILVTDYCWDKEKVDKSYRKNFDKGYISIATYRDLNSIPEYPENPFNENGNNIFFLSQAKNFLYLINPENFDTKEDFISTLEQTNYDVLIIDAFFNGEPLTYQDVERLKYKPNGSRRLVIAYMSIGEAEDYRYYWKSEWYDNPPEWLEEENPDWAGNYKVRYWYKEWQDIIYGNENSYLDKILKAGFDGVYLDIIDAYEYFEEKYGTNNTSSQDEKKKAKVIRVIDGDTIVVKVDGKREKVRLIGIDTPETRRNKRAKLQAREQGKRLKTIIKMGRKAKKYVKSLVKRGDKVYIELDLETRDKYGRLLGYVWLDNGKMLNEEIICNGYAMPLTIPPNVKYEDKFLTCYQYARENNLGLWKNKIEEFICGTKKYCRQMDSCEEAMFYLNECGLKRLDGDKDGIPCERLCRN